MTAPVRLSRGDYTAEIAAVGAALRSVRHDGRELLFRVEGDPPVPPFAGLALAPWPNRIADGRYDFGGVTHQLPINEIEYGNALHGLALWDRWTVAATTTDAVTLAHTLYPRPGYPFTIALTARYALAEDGMTIELTATNESAAAAPVGLSTHPYLTVGDERSLDDWLLRLPCADVIETDARLLPAATVPVADAGLDFNEPVRIGSRMIDHAFAAITFDDNGRARASLTGGDGAGVQISWDTACRWLQVYTVHAPGQPMHRRAVAIEPMTCAPDAFNSGQGLLVLRPGEFTSMSCTIAAFAG